MNSIRIPTFNVINPTSFRAVELGKLYFGAPDTDPRILINQIVVNGIKEDGGVVAMAQPIRTNSAGIPVYNGSPVVLSCLEAEYSIAIDTSSDVQTGGGR